MKKLVTVMLITVSMISCTKERLADNSSSAAGSSSSSGMEDNNARPPQLVLNAFATNFGNVPVLQWKLITDGTWRAHFIKVGVRWEATYKADGTLVKSEAAG